MSAYAESGRNCLTGYTEFLNPSTGRAIVPVTMEKGPTITAPHIASNDYWYTDIAVMNTGTEDSTTLFSAYNTEGEQIGLFEYQLKAKQNFVNRASDIFSDISPEEIASIKIDSQNSQQLSGIMLYGTTNGIQLAGVPIHPASGSSLYLPHIACTEPWWTGIGIMNTGDMEAEVSLTLFKENGEALTVKTENLKPNQRWCGSVKDLFDDDTLQTARYMKIETDNGQPISGIYLIATTDGLRLMGG